MLKLIREHSSSWLIKSVLWLVVAAFLGTIFYSWGMGEYAERQGVVARVMDQKVSYDEYREALDQMYDFYRNALQGRNVNDVIPQAQLKRAAIDSLIQRKLLVHEANKMGLKVSKKEIIDRIRSMPALQHEGRFDMDYYTNFLQYNRVTAKDFENNQRIVILTDKMEKLIRNSVKASDIELKEAYERQRQKINLDYMVISPELFEGKEGLTDEKISEYFQKEKEKFRKPDQIKVEYLFADPVSFEQNVKIGEQNLKNYYTDHLDEFMENEEVRASHILIKKLPSGLDLKVDEKMKKQVEEDIKKQEEKAKTKAENILAELKNNGSFEELAKKHSEDKSNAAKGGDLGFFSHGGMIKEFEDAAFSLNVGEISEIVETIYGYHIIKVTEKKESGTKPLDDVKEEIKNKLIDRRSKKLAKRSLLEILKNENSLNQFDNANTSDNLKKGATEFFSLSDRDIPSIGASSGFRTEAFSLNENEISRLVETEAGYYLLKLSEKKASYLPELQEVKEEVTKSLSQIERDRISKEEAGRLHKEFKNGTPLVALADQLDIQLSHTGFFDRDEAINSFRMNRFLVDAAFKLKEKESAVVPVSGKYYIVYMSEKTRFDEEQYKTDKESFLETYLQEKQTKVLSAWMVNLRKNANVTINEQFL